MSYHINDTDDSVIELIHIINNNVDHFAVL